VDIDVFLNHADASSSGEYTGVKDVLGNHVSAEIDILDTTHANIKISVTGLV